MLHHSLHPPLTELSPGVTAAWVEHTADRVGAAVEDYRATWQFWHLWAEAQRQLRASSLIRRYLDQVHRTY